jgi:hypothetical protein
MAKAEIYEDDQGRRRVDRTVGPAPPTQEQRLEARIAGLEKLVATLESKLDGMSITGNEFSGSGPNGIKFTMPDPTVTATLDCEADPPTLTVTVEF